MEDTEDCPHLIAGDDEVTCVDCGRPIENPEFSTVLFRQWGLEVRALEKGQIISYQLPDLGNLPAIIELARNTIEEYDHRAELNEDPQNPSKPKLQLIGGRLTRISFNQIWREVVEPSYYAAVGFGYKGTIDRWQDIVKEARDN